MARQNIPITKVDKYKWRLRDKPGVFLEIPKHSLRIDHTYQRSLVTQDAVLAIAANWSWIDCGSLRVAMRGSEFFVLDGQHRLLGALKRADVQSLPCMVYETEDVRQEAASFISINTHRKNVRALDKFKAALAAGDDLCTYVDGIVRGNGVRIVESGGTGSLQCVSTCLRIAKEDRQMFRSIFPLVNQMHSQGEILGDVMAGVFENEKMKVRLGKSLLKEPFCSKLIRAGAAVVHTEIRRLSIERNKGGFAVYRDAVESILKKRI